MLSYEDIQQAAAKITKIERLEQALRSLNASESRAEVLVRLLNGALLYSALDVQDPVVQIMRDRVSQLKEELQAIGVVQTRTDSA